METAAKSGKRAILGAALWAVATLVGIPGGIMLLFAIDPPKMRWLGLSFPALMFVTQYGALALVGRHRPLLALAGVGLTFAGSFCATEMLPRDLDLWMRTGAYGLFLGTAWAAACARDWKQALAWLILGALAVMAGHWFLNYVYRETRDSFDAKSTRRIVAALGMALPIMLVTTPLAWWSGRAQQAAEELPRHTASPKRLLFGRVTLGIAGVYLILLAGGTIYGAWQGEPEAEQRPDFMRMSLEELRRVPTGAGRAPPRNAVDIGAWSWLIAGACGAVGIALLLRVNAARYLFQVVAPAGALAIASVFPHEFWKDDLPLVILLALPFAVLVFFLGRRMAIAAATLRPDGTSARGTWIARGVPIALGLLAAGFVAYVAVKLNKPQVKGAYGAALRYKAQLEAMNEQAKRMAIVAVFLWHAAPALLAATLPFFGRASEASRPRADDAD